MAVVIGAFVGTFVLVCALAYWLLSSRRVQRQEPEPLKPVEAAEARATVAGAHPAAIPAKVYHSLQWLRRMTGAKPLPPIENLGHQPPPSLAVKIAMSIAIVVVGGGVVLGITAVMLQLANWTLFPAMDLVAPTVMDIFLRPGGAALLAIVVILIGIPLSKRFRRPARFRAGIALIALALTTFWPMQYFAASRTMPFPEFKTALHFGAFFISLTMFAAGLETMRRSRNTPEDDSWEM